MKKKIIWPILSCLMVVTLVLGSCAPAATEEEKVLKAEVEAFINSLFEAAVAKDVDYLSDKWWEGEEGRKGLSQIMAMSWTGHQFVAASEGFRGIKTLCVEVYEGEVWINKLMTAEGEIEHEPVPGLQGDTATYQGKIILPGGTLYYGFRLFKLGGEWKIYSFGRTNSSQVCP